MMKSTTEIRRVMLAVTESSSLPDLWRAVTEHLAGASAELITIFVSDDRRRRAASLPFTREVSRISGGSENFTPRRAAQVDSDAVVRTRRRLRQLAAEAEIQLVFQILAENEAARIHEFVTAEPDLLVAPSFFESRPIYTELARLKCRILLVDTEDVTATFFRN